MRGRFVRLAGLVLALGLAACQTTPPSVDLPTLGGSSATVTPAAVSPAAGSAAPGGGSAGPSDQASARPGDRPVRHVLAISVDALNPTAITELGAARTPNLHRLIREGAATLNARSERELTLTLPNHTGMLTGRRVDAERGGHGVTFNVDNGKTVHAAAGEYVSSVFDVVHDRGGSTALYSAKEKFALFSRSWNTAGAPDRVGPDDGRHKIDTVVLDPDNTRLVRSLDRKLSGSAPEFTLLHISLPDVAGHAHGFMGRQYLTAVRQTDALLGRVLGTIAGDPELRAHLVIILTADHGGQGASHSDPTRLADYRVPFIVWGPGVAKGQDLYALNPTYADPGTSRPGYGGPQPIRNGDVANLATDLLGLPAVPGSQFDRDDSLVVHG